MANVQADRHRVVCEGDEGAVVRSVPPCVKVRSMSACPTPWPWTDGATNSCDRNQRSARIQLIPNPRTLAPSSATHQPWAPVARKTSGTAAGTPVASQEIRVVDSARCTRNEGSRSCCRRLPLALRDRSLPSERSHLPPRQGSRRQSSRGGCGAHRPRRVARRGFEPLTSSLKERRSREGAYRDS